jgi:murein DD-endopeptidase MepM/ murein hydrolase activator NlpD
MEHSDGTTSWYAHMSKRIAQKGDYLQPGDKIGLVGASGHTTGPHLHFETHNANDEKINPVTWLQTRVWKAEPAADSAPVTPVSESATTEK